MSMKKLLGLIAFGFVTYFCFQYLAAHFSADAMVYKRYADALLDNEITRVRPLIGGHGAEIPFQASRERREFVGGEIRFAWYEFLVKEYSADGNTARLTVVQNLRVDPPGEKSFLGTETRRDEHSVILVRESTSWKVQSFSDAATLRQGAQLAAR